MNNITDNAFVPSTEEQVTDHFEDTDNLADADGVDARNGHGTHATTRETTPPYVLAEFEWKSRLKPATGEPIWFMTPIASAVQSLINEAPDILNIGIDEMGDEDHALARQMAVEINNLAQTLIAIDTYQEKSLKRHFNDQLARKAIYAVRTTRAAEEWSSRVQAQDKEEPENLTAMIEHAFNDAKQVSCHCRFSSRWTSTPTQTIPS